MDTAAPTGAGIIPQSALRFTNVDLTTRSANTDSLVSSHQLASKLRKIKENLDNCYVTTSNTSTTTTTTTTTTTPQLDQNDLIQKLIKKSLTDTTKTSNTPSSASSISKLLILNNENNFDFELNNDNTSLDFIIDQIKYDDLVKENTNNTKNNKLNKNLNNYYSNNNMTNLVSLKQTTFTDNLSRQSSIRSLISNEGTKHKTPNLNNNNQYHQPQQQQQQSLLNTQRDTPTNTNLTVLTKPTNVNLINSASTGVLASVGVCTIPPTPQQFQPNKIRQIKARQSNNQNSGNLSPIYSKHEIELLNDWDKYKPYQLNSNQTLLNNMNSNKSFNSNPPSPIRKGRPETRLGFQFSNNDGVDTPDSINNELCVNNNNNNDNINLSEYLEYADNSTVISSPELSNKQHSIDNNSEIYSEYQQHLQIPLNVNNNNFNLLNKVDNINNKNGRVSVESVLSNFVSNLKFDEFTKTSNPTSSKKSMEEFNHDFDIVTVSEPLTDEPCNHYQQQQQKQQENKTTPSLIIREKKSHNTHKTTQHHHNHNQSESTNQRFQTNGDLKNYNNDNIDNEVDDDDDDVEDLDKSSTVSSNQRVKNYQRLSHSINDLFSNLLQQLEKQKNKDYSNLNLLNTNEYFQLNPNDLARLTSKNSSFFLNHNQNGLRTTTNTNKYPNLSKDSNKDSGFNQEFICDESMSNHLNKQSSIDQNSLTSNNSQNEDTKHLVNLLNENKDIYLKPLNQQSSLNNLCDDLSELSLLDRFLNNEQLVAFKHTKLERLLSKKFNIHDFTIIEYILNQESISFTTFKSLIREKFKQFKWTDDILYDLHKIINQPIEAEHFYPDDQQNIYTCYDNDNFYSDENHLTPETIKNDTRMCDDLQLDKKSQTSSMKSFKKIKLIKSSISYKRKLNQLEAEMTANNSSNNLNDLQETLLRTNLSFITKRRERKGSLPEINTSHIVDFDTTMRPNDSSRRFLNNTNSNNNTISCSNFNSSTIRLDDVNESTNERMSRKSAFVLEILRTSMFRSKSLSDLNTSLVKIERNSNVSNHNQQNNNNNNNKINSNHLSTNYLNRLDESTVNINHDYTLDTSLQDSNKLHSENYTGLIWQCADMIYDEYKNKYEELRWLMNGDNLSVSAKLKEVEQRLRIELKLREKNSHLLDKLNTENLNLKNKYVHTRLESQLKLINEKIKELEMMRLFLKMCEINNRGLEVENLNRFFNISNDMNKYHRDKHNMLEGKSCDDILKSLYGCESICSGFVYQFFVIYRYMFSSIDLLEFFKINFIKALASNFPQREIILDRTIDLIGMWLDGFYIVDFQQNQELIDELESFIENEIKSYNETKYQMIYNLLINPNVEFNLFSSNNKKSEIKNKNNKNIKKVENETKKINRILNGEIKKKVLTKCKSSEHLLENEETSTNLSNSLYRHANFFIDDYPGELVASQLTLIEWDNFLDIHVCHCLNSRAQGVNCDSKQPIDPSIINTKQCLFVDNYLSKSLYKMIQFNFLLSHWVSAEILMVENLKSQANVITKFLKIAKKCYDWSNFSSAFAIYDGLQEVTVRNLRAWQQVSHKTFQILDKIANVKLLFQNEPFLLNHLSKSSNTPVIPSMHLFLLVVQKSEHGSFQLANGEWKWSKLSKIANLVDQIRIVQQHYKCLFIPCEEFVEELLQRIYYFKDIDLNQLAENNLQDYFHNQKFNSSYTSTSILNLIAIKKRL